MRRAASLLLLSALLAACAGPGSSPTGTAAVAPPSGTAACPQAPTVPDDLPGWGMPAGTPEVVPYLIAPSPVACGENRMLFTVLDAQGRPKGSPDRTVRIAFFELGRDRDKPYATVDFPFIWAIEGSVGIYAAPVAFPEAGRYGAEVTTTVAGGTPTTLRLTFDVQPSTPVVRVGDKAPSTKTPTLAQFGNDPARISTDTTPLPAFYETSVDQAIASKEPFVLIFATPKFCASAQCGPTLERIKPFVSRYPDVTFINVEPYRLKLVDGVLQADTDANNQLQSTQAADDWRLLSEPYVFVVNREGIVTASFELIFSEAELIAALDALK